MVHVTEVTLKAEESQSQPTADRIVQPDVAHVAEMPILAPIDLEQAELDGRVDLEQIESAIKKMSVSLPSAEQDGDPLKKLLGDEDFDNSSHDYPSLYMILPQSKPKTALAKPVSVENGLYDCYMLCEFQMYPDGYNVETTAVPLYHPVPSDVKGAGYFSRPIKNHSDFAAQMIPLIKIVFSTIRAGGEGVTIGNFPVPDLLEMFPPGFAQKHLGIDAQSEEDSDHAPRPKYLNVDQLKLVKELFGAASVSNSNN